MDSEPSFVAAHLLEYLGATVKANAEEELAPYRARATKLGSNAAAEWHRAFACTRWAVGVAAQPEQGHLAQFLATSQEAVRLFGDAVAAKAERLVPETGCRVSAQFAAERAWVDEACRLASEMARDAAGRPFPGAAGWTRSSRCRSRGPSPPEGRAEAPRPSGVLGAGPS